MSRGAVAKRALDLVLGGAGLLLCSPLLGGLAAAIWLTDGRPILFRHVRPGLHGRPFTLFKFRTMSARRGADGALLPDEERMTRLGNVLRTLSLDELPELLNVVRGDMSLVGPRPLLIDYLDRYTPEQARRHDVKPGLTGLAQVRGRNALSWDDKFALDVEYVDRRSVWLDLAILVRTPVEVVRARGVSAPGYVTAPPFGGEIDEVVSL